MFSTQEREDVPGARDEAHPEQKAVEHQPEDAKRPAAFVRRRVGDPVNGRGKAQRGDERQKERTKEIEPNLDAAGGGHVRENDFKGAARRKNGQSGRKARAATDDGPKRRDDAGGAGRWRQRRQHGADHIPRNHHTQGDAVHIHQRTACTGACAGGVDVDRRRSGKRPSASRMPRSMSEGSGGQPAMLTSTGMTLSTGPTTA